MRAFKTLAKGFSGEVKAAGRMWTGVAQQMKPGANWYEWILRRELKFNRNMSLSISVEPLVP